MYYTIGEVAEMFTVNTSLIRFWEKEFKQLKPKKNSKGNRLFTPKDILLIQQIYQLVKVEGFTLEGAKKTLQSPPVAVVVSPLVSPIKDNTDLIQRLERVKAKLLSLKS